MKTVFEELDTPDKAYVRIDRWGSYENQFYDKRELIEFLKWIWRRCGHNIDIYFDRRMNVATVDFELGGTAGSVADGGKYTLISLRSNDKARRPVYIESIHKPLIIKEFKAYKALEEKAKEKVMSAYKY